MKELKVIILGSAGTGKSTLAAIIKNALENDGVKVKIEDQDFKAGELSLTEAVKRFEALNKEIDVTITTQQLSRKHG